MKSGWRNDEKDGNKLKNGLESATIFRTITNYHRNNI